jgi:hypothetical protein
LKKVERGLSDAGDGQERSKERGTE